MEYESEWDVAPSLLVTLICIKETRQKEKEKQGATEKEREREDVNQALNLAATPRGCEMFLSKRKQEL